MTADWQLSIEYAGTEREPIVIIDNFASDPDGLREDAAMLAYAPMGIHYPGIRAAMPYAVTRRMIATIGPIARDVFDAESLDLTEAFYSLVTTRPGDLTPIQRLPHFDGVEPTRFALLHYLSPAAPGGTAFYRHQSTGFETVTTQRLPAYRAALESDLARTGIPAPGYIDGDTAVYDQVSRVEGRFNRAILYRGNRLHCAWLPQGTSFDDQPAAGRLTANLFLQVGGTS